MRRTRPAWACHYPNTQLTISPVTDVYEVAQAEIDAAFKYLDQSRVMAYELGNEANFYGSFNGKRPKSWGVIDYGKQMLSWLPRLSSRATGSPPSFQFGAFVGPPTQLEELGAFIGPSTQMEDFTLLQLTKMGVPQSIEGVRYFSEHGYPGNICTSKC
jgi:hypothetical protein